MVNRLLVATCAVVLSWVTPAVLEAAPQEVRALQAPAAATTEAGPRALTSEAWRADLRALVDSVAARHRAPWAHVSEAAFRAAAATLDAQIPALSDRRIMIEMAALVAMLKDGHSRLSLPMTAGEAQRQAHLPTPLPADAALLVRAYPISLYRFSDGLFVQAAADTHAAIIGSQVLRLGQMTADDALRAVRRYTNADNDLGHALNGPRLLGIVDVCEALGITDAAGRLSMLVKDPAGRERRIDLDPLAPGVMPAMVQAYQRPGATVPLWLRNTQAPHWMEYLADRKAVFAQVNSVADAPGKRMAEFAADLAAFVRTHEVTRVILDLRWNGGGNNYLNRALVLALTSLPDINRPGALYTLIGRYTFSAAMNLTSQLELWTQTIFVGEPTGASPSHYGDAKRVTLPRSGLTVRLSSVYWRDWSVDESRTSVEPELTVGLSSADYFAGRDPVLEAALAHREPAAIADQLLGAFERGGADAAWRRQYQITSDPRTAGVDLFEDLRLVGRGLLGRGRTADALQVFQQNQASRPESFEANADLGEALATSGKAAEAIPYLEKALAIKADPVVRTLLDSIKR
jgi:hypothetical protein